LCLLGFPAADAEVPDFLTKKCNEATATIRAHAFLVALFGRTTIWVEEQDSAINGIAQMFRLYMTQGQKQDHPNENRIKFYQEVAQTAEWVCRRLSSDMDVYSDSF
jgi:hypothetical protein